MPDDLLARLRAHLDEDERVALAAIPGPWTANGFLVNARSVNPAQVWSTPSPATAEHIARHDPARVLRWVAAAREVLDEHERKPWIRDLSYCGCCSDKRGDSMEDWPCATVRALAGVYGEGE